MEGGDAQSLAAEPTAREISECREPVHSSVNVRPSRFSAVEPRQNLYRALDDEWATVGESSSARSALARWALAEPALSRFDSPASVVRACRRRDDPIGADRLLAAVLRYAEEPLAARTVLQAVLPGLAAQVRRRTRHSRDLTGDGAVPWECVEDLDGEAVTRALERINDLAGNPSARVAQSIVDAAWVGLRSGAARRERRGRIAMIPLEEAPDPSAPPSRSAADELAVVIVRAVQESVLRPRDAAVIYTSRVMGFSLADLASAQGRDVRAVRLQRARAERTLVRKG